MRYSNLHLGTVLMLLLSISLPWNSKAQQFFAAELYKNSSRDEILLLDQGQLKEAVIGQDFFYIQRDFRPEQVIGCRLQFVNAPNSDFKVIFGVRSSLEQNVYQEVILEDNGISTTNDGLILDQTFGALDRIQMQASLDRAELLVNDVFIADWPISLGSQLQFYVSLVSASGEQVLVDINNVTDYEFRVNFTEEAVTIVEGESFTICADLTKANPLDKAITARAIVVGGGDPLLPDINEVVFSFPPGANGPICYSFETRKPNGLVDTKTTYVFKLLSTSQENLLIGSKDVFLVNISDDGLLDNKMIYEGDLIFTGFDNDIGGGADRISITSLITLEKGMCFSLSDGLLDIDDGVQKWYNQFLPVDTRVKSQLITYWGEDQLPVGTVICLDLPSSGTGDELLANNIKVNGTASDDFRVENDGVNPNPNIELSSTEPDHLFILQGRWHAELEYSRFFGRTIHGIQVGGNWISSEGSISNVESKVPGDVDCFEVATCSASGHCYGYYNCQGNPYLVRVNFIEEASDFSNWVTGLGTAINDLPSGACQQQCRIVEEDPIKWDIPAQDLILACNQVDVQEQIDQWLGNHGNGTVVSQCAGSVIVTHDYEPTNLDKCNGALGQLVTFTATDLCDETVIVPCTARIILQGAGQIQLISEAENYTVDCESYNETHYLDWLENNGNAMAQAGCSEIEWDYSISKEIACSTSVLGDLTILKINAQFVGTDACGYQIFTGATYSIVVNSTPSYFYAPKNLVLNCNDPLLETKVSDWLENFAYGTFRTPCHPDLKIDALVDGFDVDDLAGCGEYPVSFILKYEGCINRVRKASAKIIIEGAFELSGGNDLQLECNVSPEENQIKLNQWLAAHGNINVTSGQCGVLYWTHNTPLLDCDDARSVEVYPVTFTAEDECGNIETKTLNVELRNFCNRVGPANLSLDPNDCTLLRARASACVGSLRGPITWFKDGQEISGADQYEYRITQSGLYRVEFSCDYCPKAVQEQITHPCDNAEIAIERNQNILSVAINSCMEPKSFHWTKPGGSISTLPTVEVSLPGTYMVTVDFGQCERTATYDFTIMQVCSIPPRITILDTRREGDYLIVSFAPEGPAGTAIEFFDLIPISYTNGTATYQINSTEPMVGEIGVSAPGCPSAHAGFYFDPCDVSVTISAGNCDN